MTDDKITCSVCNGSGYIKEDNESILCNHCFGKGKINWVDNAFGNPIESCLSRISTRRLIGYIKTCIEEFLEECNDQSQIRIFLINFLDKIKIKRGIYDFCVNVSPLGDIINVLIKPNLSLEIISLDFSLISRKKI